MELSELAATALRAFAVYAVLLLVLRLLGRREIGNFSAFDLLVALMIGEVVDEMIYGTEPFARGLIIILTIALCEVVVSWMSFKSDRADRVLGGSPLDLVRDGQLCRDALRKERMNEQELWSALRVHGIDREELADLRRVTLEPSGEVSVLLVDGARPARRMDLAARARPPADSGKL